MSNPTPAFPIKPSPDGRYLVDQRGRPFFYHADTAWNLPKMLSLAEAEDYFTDRRTKGFTAIQIQAVSKEQGPPSNQAGEAPFSPITDIRQPNEPYWRHLDGVLAAARTRGLLVAIAPLWLRGGGDDEEGWRSELTAEAARPYGRFLGRRYRRFDNLLWILGGDADPKEKIGEVRELALGIREAAPHHLLTYHAAPDHTSAHVLPDEPWLDINFAYTYRETPLLVLPEYQRRPARPIILGESGYEGEDKDGRGGEPRRMRRQAYGALLSGALGGHAFGQQHLWRFSSDWRASLESPASRQMMHLQQFFATRPWYRLTPDAERRLLRKSTAGDSAAQSIAARTPDGQMAVVYLPVGGPITLNLGLLAAPAMASWFDPATGLYFPVDDSPLPNRGEREFTAPPKNGAGDPDWVLLLTAR